MNYMTVGLKKEVSLVLLPIDDFTGRIIMGSGLRVYIKEENRPSIRKPDGYHIFCNLSGGEAEICLEGPLYQKRILRLPIVRGKPNICLIRMLPGPVYPLPQGATVITGVLPEGSTIRLFFSGAKKVCRLLDDYDPERQGEALSLFRPYEMSLEGKMLCVCEKENEPEFFRVTGKNRNICMLDRPLSKAYRKTATAVYPVYEAIAGEGGIIYLPVNGLAGEERGICVLMKAGEKEKICEMAVTAGKENRITEKMWEVVS